MYKKLYFALWSKLDLFQTMDPYRHIKGLTLQITGICSRINNKQSAVKDGLNFCMNLAHQIDSELDKIHQQHELQMQHIREQNRSLLKANASLSKEKWSLTRKIRKISDSETKCVASVADCGEVKDLKLLLNEMVEKVCKENEAIEASHDMMDDDLNESDLLLSVSAIEDALMTSTPNTSN